MKKVLLGLMVIVNLYAVNSVEYITEANRIMCKKESLVDFTSGKDIKVYGELEENLYIEYKIEDDGRTVIAGSESTEYRYSNTNDSGYSTYRAVDSVNYINLKRSLFENGNSYYQMYFVLKEKNVSLKAKCIVTKDK